MPLYEYQCQACGERFEVIRKFSDPPLEACARCGGGPIERLQSSPAIQFKGAGWYITDYAQKDRKGASDSAGAGESAGSKDKAAGTDDGKGKTAATSSTPEAKPASGPPPSPGKD